MKIIAENVSEKTAIRERPACRRRRCHFWRACAGRDDKKSVISVRVRRFEVDFLGPDNFIIPPGILYFHYCSWNVKSRQRESAMIDVSFDESSRAGSRRAKGSRSQKRISTKSAAPIFGTLGKKRHHMMDDDHGAIRQCRQKKHSRSTEV